MSSPRIGFISLGCPKALVDSERILTKLRAEGYELVPTYQDSDLVVVNTCGFIDDAVQESLDAIGEALKENGKVIVTGCLGAREEEIRARHPAVLKVTGAHAYEEVVAAVHEHAPPSHDPFVDVVPPEGIKLTPRHYAYLKISEGCNHRCTFCIIPSMRGDLVSRPIGDVLNEARALFEGGVKELLVISQDTSAYGVDVAYRTGFWDGKPIKTRLLELVEALADLAHAHGAWVRLHYVYPYPSVDDVVPLMAEGKVLPYLDIPLQHSHPDVLRRMKRPASGENAVLVQLDFGEDESGLMMKALRTASGYYIDVGASELISSGQIGVIAAHSVARVVPEGVVLDNGRLVLEEQDKSGKCKRECQTLVRRVLTAQTVRRLLCVRRPAGARVH
jgi:ribosomal protein S12 methylthiotransferase